MNNLGWSSYFEESFKPFKEQGYAAGRVIAEFKNKYRVSTEYGDVLAEISGKFRYEVDEQNDYPAVGDWVVLSVRQAENSATIHKVLPRKSKFSRRAAGVQTKEQIVAANIDTVFLVSSLNNDFNIRRLERYMILAWESGADPVIILSKADLCNDLEDKLRQVQDIAIGVPVHVISSVQNYGLEELKEYIKEGRTVALLGSSGVGKSTLVNLLMGSEVMKTNEVREVDDRGRHTSSHREVFIIPNGGLIIDTPGMRELQLWDGNEGISDAFGDIEALAKGCSFKNCKHEKEPGCAVREAIWSGLLTEDRLESYNKLQKEIRFVEQKQKNALRKEVKRNHKASSKIPRDKSYKRMNNFD